MPDISPLGGRSAASALHPSCDAEDWRKPRKRPISPLVGEMSGRTEGGAKDRNGTAHYLRRL
ncbi:MAG: hypothetical protein EOR46_10525 [Mesorhizobium sp.]|nr:MAG: hypothetical protein EOR46_10525 [Mesorhizobium sp.]RWK68896.1 MAG: hypothetical protein EOR54_12335 [Mesorhizobium sp.]RWK76579.1 MAG: hypothetical protein EOR50_13940 [Mesorhizobium sp.]RWK82339.1 MAG: hypothetical protein EOR51_13565 [Mesorhizobium sp.]RWL02967.1 MAG: hypothetical protein EOR55_20455 [Mesorhizobium sp.]